MVLTHYGFDWSIGTFEYGLPSYPGCPVSEDVYNHFTDAESTVHEIVDLTAVAVIDAIVQEKIHKH